MTDHEAAANYRWLLEGTLLRQGLNVANRGERAIERNAFKTLMRFQYWGSPDEVHEAITKARKESL